MKSLVTFPRSDKACWWQKLFDPQRTVDGGTMPEASIKTQALLVSSEMDCLWAYYKQSQYGKAVLVLAMARRVGFSL
jgi:hypothetical protein